MQQKGQASNTNGANGFNGDNCANNANNNTTSDNSNYSSHLSSNCESKVSMSWHPHVYGKPPKQPTSFLIENILGNWETHSNSLSSSVSTTTSSESNGKCFAYFSLKLFDI